MKVEAFQYDLVDVARQVFMNLGINLYEEVRLITYTFSTVALLLLMKQAPVARFNVEIDRFKPRLHFSSWRQPPIATARCRPYPSHVE